MAYVSQEMKKALTPAIKAVLKKHRVKASISVNNHSTLCVNIKEGAIDFIGEQNKKNMETCRQRGVPFVEAMVIFKLMNTTQKHTVMEQTF